MYIESHLLLVGVIDHDSIIPVPVIATSSRPRSTGIGGLMKKLKGGNRL